jgi:hypothetical protein
MVLTIRATASGPKAAMPAAERIRALNDELRRNLPNGHAVMTTTHRGLDNPSGMPNPSLLDYQVKEVTVYLLSLRK